MYHFRCPARLVEKNLQDGISERNYFLILDCTFLVLARLVNVQFDLLTRTLEVLVTPGYFVYKYVSTALWTCEAV